MAKILKAKNIEKELDGNFRQWDNLIKCISEGKIIPIIGSDFIVDDEDYPGVHSATKILLSELALYYEKSEEYNSFSELYFDLKDGDRRDFYNTLGQIFESGFELQPSSVLIEFLHVLKQCNCPFVITTSITPVVEKAMRQVFGEVKVMAFNNNPQNSEDIDVKSKEDFLHPTLYYMFGKVNRSEKTYVITDTDMLSFCKSWLTEGKRPTILTSILRDRYPLFLGNNFSDWLCRFIWLSIKESFDNNPGMLVHEEAEESLLKFLKRIDAFTQKDVACVINKIKRLLDERTTKMHDPHFSCVKTDMDVFISYSRTDKEVAEKLYDDLTRVGLTVWYDRLSLGAGDKFMSEIRRSIRTAKVFVPIITHHVEEEKNEAHVYRQEWGIAVQRSKEFGRTFMYPVSEENFDFYRGTLPEELTTHNATMYSAQNPNFTEFAQILKNVISHL